MASVLVVLVISFYWMEVPGYNYPTIGDNLRLGESTRIEHTLPCSSVFGLLKLMLWPAVVLNNGMVQFSKDTEGK